jgi:hypothetical protein
MLSSIKVAKWSGRVGGFLIRLRGPGKSGEATKGRRAPPKSSEEAFHVDREFNPSFLILTLTLTL